MRLWNETATIRKCSKVTISHHVYIYIHIYIYRYVYMYAYIYNVYMYIYIYMSQWHTMSMSQVCWTRTSSLWPVLQGPQAHPSSVTVESTIPLPWPKVIQGLRWAAQSLQTKSAGNAHSKMCKRNSRHLWNPTHPYSIYQILAIGCYKSIQKPRRKRRKRGLSCLYLVIPYLF